jgi:hypothetical protein
MFEQAPPLEADIDGWHLVLADKELKATSVEAIEPEEAARAALEPILRAWEAVAYLRDQHDVCFVADGADQPPHGFTAMPDEDRILVRNNHAYPAPEPRFERAPLVDILLAVLRRFDADVPSLPQAVREVVGLVEGKDLGLADDVMSTLRELDGRVGSRYRGPEWQWMQEALRLVTLQAGLGEAARRERPLTMADFASQLAITDPGRG